MGLQLRDVGRVEHRSPAAGDDGVARLRRLGDGLPLPLTEPGFALFGEDGGDRSSRVGLDRGVDVDEVAPEPAGEGKADGALARAHHADQHDGPRSGRAHRASGRIRCR